MGRIAPKGTLRVGLPARLTAVRHVGRGAHAWKACKPQGFGSSSGHKDRTSGRMAGRIPASLRILLANKDINKIEEYLKEKILPDLEKS
jgi:hypothetical protein